MAMYDGEGRKKKKVTKENMESPTEKTVSYKSDDCFTQINSKVQDAKNDSTSWATKQAKYNRLRMRIKKSKTFPFVGCSNLRMPTAEIKIKKLKAALTNVIFGIRPIVQAVPSPSGTIETAMKIEKWLDHLLMDKMEIKPECIIAIDQALENGFFIVKPYWKFEVNYRNEEYKLEDLTMEEAMFVFDGNNGVEDIIQFLVEKFEIDMTEKVAMENADELEKVAMAVISGKDNLEFTVQDVLYDAPDIALIEPEKLYVPSTTGFNPQSAQWMCHEYEMPMQQLEMCAKYKGWDIESVNGLKDQVNTDSRTLRDYQLDQKEGIDRLQGKNGLVKIWEWYGWYDVNGDGIKEKACITMAPDFKKVMRKIGLPFDNGKWPFVKFYYELTTDRWFSHRGVVEIAEDLIKEIDVQHNMKLDAQTTRNAPMFLYRAGMVNPNLVQMTPNQAIPVRGGQPLNDTVAIVNAHNPNVEYSYEREQMLLEAKVEELIGQIDYTLQSMINKRQPRTLGEVEMQQQAANSVFTLDSDMFRGSFGDLFNFIWDLWCQYGNDQEEFMYFGQNGWEPIRLSKEEIQGKYRFTVRGNDTNTNPGVKLQKAQQIIQAVTNPALLQMGVITPIQAVNGLKRFFQTLDIEGFEQFINMEPQPQQPPPVGAIIKPKFKEMTEGEQAQVLQSLGINPDIEGKILNRQTEMFDRAMEMEAQRGAMNAQQAV